jgi:hypothetical protein
MIDICVPCKEKGKFRAPYKTINGVPMCGGCVADYERKPKVPVAPKLEVKMTSEPAPPSAGHAKEVKQMGRGPATSQETIDAIRKDAAAGLTTNQIAEKHGVSWPTAKRYADGKAGKKPAGGGDTSSSPRRAAARASSNGHFAVKLTTEGLDAVWNALPAEKKAELLGNL